VSEFEGGRQRVLRCKNGVKVERTISETIGGLGRRLGEVWGLVIGGKGKEEREKSSSGQSNCLNKKKRDEEDRSLDEKRGVLYLRLSAERERGIREDRYHKESSWT